MPDNPFDRNVINPREKPLSEDVNRYLSQLDRALRYFARSMFASSSGVPTSGFLQNGLNVVEDSPQAMSVILKAGLGFQDLPADVPASIDGIVGLDDLESYKPLPLLADLVVSIPTAPTAPNTRIDILEVRADRLKTDSQSRQVFNNATEVFDATPIDKTLEFLLDGTKFGSVASPSASTAAISLKTGVEGVPGAVPATTSGYIKVAEIAVGSDVVVIANADITDTRPKLTDNMFTQEIYIPAASMQGNDTPAGFSVNFNKTHWEAIVGQTMLVTCPLSQHLKVGDRILGLRIYLEDDSTLAIRSSIQEQTLPGIGTAIVSDQVSSDSSGGEQAIDLTNISFNNGTNILEAGKAYIIDIRSLGTAIAGMEIQSVRVQFDHPAL